VSTDLADGRTDRAAWWRPAAVYVGAVGLVAVVASWRDPGGIEGFWAWVRGAAGDYLVIAEQGYPTGTWRVATFPGFSLVLRGVAEVTGTENLALVSVVVGAAGGLATAGLLWWWMRDRGLSDRSATVGVIALLVSPAGFVLLDNPQSEAVFLPAVIGACLAVERRHRGLAAVLLTVAAATRLSAIIFILALVVRCAEQDGALRVRLRPSGAPRWHLWRRLEVRRSDLRWSAGLPMLGLAGCLAWFAYTWAAHGSPFAYFVEQSALIPSGPRWHPATWIHWGLVERASDLAADPSYLVETVVNIGMIVLCAWWTPAVLRRFGLAYACIVAAHLVMVWSLAYNFTSTSRYLLAAFPIAAIAGIRAVEGERRVVVGLVVSAAIMLWYGTMFPNGVALA